jgi:hypothetical protein
MSDDNLQPKEGRYSDTHLLDALPSDVVEFTHRLLRHPDGRLCGHHPGQVQIMRTIARVTTLVAGRQCGQSLCLAWLAVWFRVKHTPIARST